MHYKDGDAPVLKMLLVSKLVVMHCLLVPMVALSKWRSCLLIPTLTCPFETVLFLGDPET